MVFGLIERGKQHIGAFLKKKGEDPAERRRKELNAKHFALSAQLAHCEEERHRIIAETHDQATIQKRLRPLRIEEDRIQQALRDLKRTPVHDDSNDRLSA